QDLPFEKLVETLNPERHLNRAPLFQVKIVLQNTPSRTLTLSDLMISPLGESSDVAQLDLILFVNETERGLAGTLQYNTDIFESSSISRLARQFETLLAHIISGPDTRLKKLPLISQQERQRIEEQEEQYQAATLTRLKKIKRTPVTMPRKELIRTGYLDQEPKLPLVISPNVPDVDLIQWASR